MSRSLTRSGFTLFEILVCMAVIATLLGMALPAVASLREGARVTVCKNHARQIGLALQTVAAGTGRFPPNQPVPWTVDAVRLLDPTLLPPGSAADREVVWDRLPAAMLPVATFLCPTAPQMPDEERAIANHGFNGRLPGVRPAAITDGLSHTLLTAEMPSQLAAPWTWGPLVDEVNIGSAHHQRVNATRADGSTCSLMPASDLGVIRGLLDPRDGAAAGLD